MPDSNVFRLRVVFCKQGRLALLSHLEVARALERAVRRAKLPFAISQGFSPHMKIAFGAALPVGVGSSCELFDLQMTRYVTLEKALEALQNVSVADLMVKKCFYIEPHAPAASVAYPVSTYRALLSYAPPQILVPYDIKVVRKKKEKILHSVDFLVDTISLTGKTLTFSLESKAEGSLRPDVFLHACCDLRCENKEQGESISVTRPIEYEELYSQSRTTCERPKVAYTVKNEDLYLDKHDLCGENDPLRILAITRIEQHAAYV